MKKYLNPKFEIISMDATDVIATSGVEYAVSRGTATRFSFAEMDESGVNGKISD